MSKSKEEVRKNFRDSCFKRDKFTCVMCGIKASSHDEAMLIFDVHHICPRTEMPCGGFVLENGITLCHDDHLKAEEFYSSGVAIPGYSPDELYKRINSSKEKAVEASKRL